MAKKNETIRRNPKTLLTLELNFFNHRQTRENVEAVVVIDNQNESLEYQMQDQNISFEELLLQIVKRSDNSPKPQRRKVAPGAEVISLTVMFWKRKGKNKEKTLKNYNLLPKSLMMLFI
ncbi:hypothetical protein B5X24_HaOG213858 [Helicoverpa armigera]|nr:hypothetical protein B5X24_HaOG213858 [Helicoverpa armigera]